MVWMRRAGATYAVADPAIGRGLAEAEAERTMKILWTLVDPMTKAAARAAANRRTAARWTPTGVRWMTPEAEAAHPKIPAYRKATSWLRLT